MTYDKIKQKISKNFYLHEFLCHCNNCVFSKPSVKAEDLLELSFLVRLQRIRDELGAPMTVLSGARCRAHNNHIGGAPKSGHIVDENLLCKAVDIDTSMMGGADRHLLAKLAFKHGMRGIGFAKTFLHMDLKNRRSWWTY